MTLSKTLRTRSLNAWACVVSSLLEDDLIWPILILVNALRKQDNCSDEGEREDTCQDVECHFIAYESVDGCTDDGSEEEAKPDSCLTVANVDFSLVRELD